MRPVDQTTFFVEGESRGNCMAACIATIFELSLEEVDVPDATSFAEMCAWTSTRFDGALEFHEVDHGVDYRVIEDGEFGDRWTYDLTEDPPAPPTFGLWIAGVQSPRIVHETGPWRGMPGLHAVVMRGGQLAHDPHPQRDMGIGPIVTSMWWVVADPARLQLAAAA